MLDDQSSRIVLQNLLNSAGERAISDADLFVSKQENLKKANNEVPLARDNAINNTIDNTIDKFALARSLDYRGRPPNGQRRSILAHREKLH